MSKTGLRDAWKETNISKGASSYTEVLEFLRQMDSRIERKYMPRPDYEEAMFNVENILTIVFVGDAKKGKHTAEILLKALGIRRKV